MGSDRSRCAAVGAGISAAGAVGVGLLALAATPAVSSAVEITQYLYPTAGGHVRDDNADGVADVATTGALVGNLSGVQRRAVLEWNLSAWPQGWVKDVRLTGWVGPNNSAPAGTRGHGLYTYAGDNAVTTADYNRAATLLGSFSHAAGGSTPFNYAVMDRVNQARAGGNAFGVRFNPLNTQGWDAVYTGDVTRLEFTVEAGPQHTASFAPVIDYQAEYSYAGADRILTDGASTIYVQRADVFNSDERAVMEFDLGGLPAGAYVTGATLRLDVWTYTEQVGPDPIGPQLALYGYNGNEQMEFADGKTAGKTYLGFSPEVDDLGPFDVELDAEAVRELLAGGSVLGLMGYNPVNTHQVGFATTEGAARGLGTAPQLLIDYVVPSSVPEPGTAGAIGLAGAAVLLRRGRRQPRGTRG